MRIGELAARTGVSTRLLRYYEQQGLLAPSRADNAYRTYDEEDVVRVERVATLVRSGVPTRLILEILALEDAEAPEQLAALCPRDLAERLCGEVKELESRITCLTRSRDTLRRFLEQSEHAALLSTPTPAR